MYASAEGDALQLGLDRAEDEPALGPGLGAQAVDARLRELKRAR